MADTYRPDPVDWGARAAFGLIVIYAVGAVLVGFLEVGVAEVLPAGASLALQLLLVPVTILLAFGLLTLWYYRQSIRGTPSEPFPMSLSSPWEGIARFLGVLFLLHLSVLVVSIVGIVLIVLRVPFPTAEPGATLGPAAAVAGPVALFAYLVVWYARHPTPE